MRFLSAPQVADLVAATSDPYRVAVYVLAYGGLRWGELVALRRRRCDLLRSRLIVAESASAVSGRLYFGPTKTYQARSVVIPPFLRDLLAEHLENNVAADLDALVSPLRKAERSITPGSASASGTLPYGARVCRKGCESTT